MGSLNRRSDYRYIVLLVTGERIEWLDDWLKPSSNNSQEQCSSLEKFIGKSNENFSSLRDLPPLSKIVLGLSFGLAALVMVWILIDPVSLGWLLGSAAATFVGFALPCLAGAYSCIGHGTVVRIRLCAVGYPVVTILLLWTLIVGMFVDNHQVRSTGPVPTDRDTLATAALKWHDQAVKVSGNSDPPLVIVATAGGGIRAAWTATVLGRLEDEAPNFRNYLFGISGVSGGSLGFCVRNPTFRRHRGTEHGFMLSGQFKA